MLTITGAFNVGHANLMLILNNVKFTAQLKHFPSCYNQMNVFISVIILCGNIDDVVSLKSKLGQISKEILFILLDIYK